MKKYSHKGTKAQRKTEKIILNINKDGVTWNFCELEIRVHESCFDPCAK